MNYNNTIARSKALEILLPDINDWNWSDSPESGLFENLTFEFSKPNLVEEEFQTQYNIEVEKLNKLSYILERKKAYKPIGEQLDMQYWDKINGTTLWEDYITQLKLDTPKTT